MTNPHNTEKSTCTGTRTLIAQRLVYWAKVGYEITVKNFDVTHDIHFAIHVYSSTISIQFFLSLHQSKINSIFEYPFLYFGLYLVYLRCHFLSPSYSINKSNYLYLIHSTSTTMYFRRVLKRGKMSISAAKFW